MEAPRQAERPASNAHGSERAEPRKSLPEAITGWMRTHWIGSSVVAYIAVFLMVFQPREILEAFEQGKASTQQAAVLMAAGLPLFLLLAWLYDRRLARKPLLDIKVASTGVGTVLVVVVLVVAAFAGINQIRISDEAITAFQIGREYDRRPDISAYNLRLAERQYVRATEADPNFALAFAYLSKLHMRLYFLGYDETSARLEMARAAIDRARELDRDLPQISLAEGYYYYWGFADYDRAERAFRDARRGGLRKEADVFAGIGYVQRRKGNWSSALRHLRRAADLDARNADRLTEVGHTYGALRCYPEAERAYRRSLELAPDALSAEIALAEAHLRSTGRTDLLGRVAAELPVNVDPDGEYLVFKVKALLYAGDSLRALGALPQSGRSVIARQGFIYTDAMLRGIVRTYMGNREGAAAPLDSARAALSAMLHNDPGNRRLHLALSQTYAALGVRDFAITHGERAIQLLRETRGDDALDLPDYQANLAAVYAWVGESGKALALLSHLVQVAAGPSPHELRLDPLWLPLRGEPRFTALTSTPQRCLIRAA